MDENVFHESDEIAGAGDVSVNRAHHHLELAIWLAIAAILQGLVWIFGRFHDAIMLIALLTLAIASVRNFLSWMKMRDAS